MNRPLHDHQHHRRTPRPDRGPTSTISARPGSRMFTPRLTESLGPPGCAWPEPPWCRLRRLVGRRLGCAVFQGTRETTCTHLGRGGPLGFAFPRARATGRHGFAGVAGQVGRKRQGSGWRIDCRDCRLQAAKPPSFPAVGKRKGSAAAPKHEQPPVESGRFPRRYGLF